jgi:hypothetical protein
MPFKNFHTRKISPSISTFLKFSSLSLYIILNSFRCTSINYIFQINVYPPKGACTIKWEERDLMWYTRISAFDNFHYIKELIFASFLSPSAAVWEHNNFNSLKQLLAKERHLCTAIYCLLTLSVNVLLIFIISLEFSRAIPRES